MSINWQDYPTDGIFDELIAEQGKPRPPAHALVNYLAKLTQDELQERQDAAHWQSR